MSRNANQRTRSLSPNRSLQFAGLPLATVKHLTTDQCNSNSTHQNCQLMSTCRVRLTSIPVKNGRTKIDLSLRDLPGIWPEQHSSVELHVFKLGSAIGDRTRTLRLERAAC